MYSKVKSKVGTNAGCSDTFNLTTGLMQGECLSLSFGSFISDLDEAMDDVESMQPCQMSGGRSWRQTPIRQQKRTPPPPPNNQGGVG